MDPLAAGCVLAVCALLSHAGIAWLAWNGGRGPLAGQLLVAEDEVADLQKRLAAKHAQVDRVARAAEAPLAMERLDARARVAGGLAGARMLLGGPAPGAGDAPASGPAGGPVARVPREDDDVG